MYNKAGREEERKRTQNSLITSGYGHKASNQIKVYLSRAPNTTGVNLTVKCLLTGSNQWCPKKGMCV